MQAAWGRRKTGRRKIYVGKILGLLLIFGRLSYLIEDVMAQGY
jgi:hypothetical protein